MVTQVMMIGWSAARLAAAALGAIAWDVIGLAGAALISWGARMVYVPAGYIVGGLFLLGATILHERGAQAPVER